MRSSASLAAAYPAAISLGRDARGQRQLLGRRERGCIRRRPSAGARGEGPSDVGHAHREDEHRRRRSPRRPPRPSRAPRRASPHPNSCRCGRRRRHRDAVTDEPGDEGNPHGIDVGDVDRHGSPREPVREISNARLASTRAGAAARAAALAAAGSSATAAARAPARAAASTNNRSLANSPTCTSARAPDQDERQHERELDRRGTPLRRSVRTSRRLRGVGIADHRIDHLVEERGELPDDFAHAISTIATAAAARITRAYSAVVCPSSRRLHGGERPPASVDRRERIEPRTKHKVCIANMVTSSQPMERKVVSKHRHHREEEEGGEDEEHEREQHLHRRRSGAFGECGAAGAAHVDREVAGRGRRATSPSTSVRVEHRDRPAKVGRREPLRHVDASSSRHLVPRSTAANAPASSTPSGPCKASAARRSASGADSPADDPAASRSRSCGTSASIAARRLAARRDRTSGTHVGIARADREWFSRGKTVTIGPRRGASVTTGEASKAARIAATAARAPSAASMEATSGARVVTRPPGACGSTGTRGRRAVSPSTTVASPAGVESAVCISVREVSQRNAKNPTGSAPRMPPDRRACAVRARTSRATATLSRTVAAT